MSSRDDILAALRKRTIPAVDKPSLDGEWIEYDDPIAQFGEALGSVGGTAISVNAVAEIPSALNQVPPYGAAKRIIDLYDAAVPSAETTSHDASPHSMQDVDFCLVGGAFGVAENGAIWIPTDNLQPRSVLFLCQHLGIVLSRDQIVHNMHQAYHRISFPHAGFGVFISGPSKTADIEQSLVIGAHGARSLTVLIVA